MKNLKIVFKDFFLTGLVIAVLLIAFGCKQSTDEIPSKFITITVAGDENVLFEKGTSVTIEKGTKWSSIKINPAIADISFKEPFRFDVWRLGSNSGIKLTDDYTFYDDIIVFAISTKCTKIPYPELDNYLKTKAQASEVNYIEVTDIPEGKLKGEDENTYSCSELGEILKKNKTKKVSLKLPDFIENTYDMSFCFFEVPNLYSLSAIPEKVTNIKACFAGCQNLIEAPALPKGITDMSDCFSRCVNLEKAPDIPEDVENMSLCFASCNKLGKAPLIHKGVKDLSACFKDCTKLETVPVLPEGIKDMGECFSGCESLKNPPDIPLGVTNIWGCFFGCSNLIRVPIIPEGVTDMEKCFEECINITETPIIPQTVTNMKKCFADCEQLQMVHNIPESVTDMTYTFGGCGKIKTVPTLPNTVEKMDYCFTRCKNLETIPNIPENVRSMHSCFLVCENLIEVPPIPENVSTMTFSFLGCKKIKNIILNCAYNDDDNGNGVKNFYSTFRDCESLDKGSIRVKAGQLEAYKKNSKLMDIKEDRFIAQ